MIDRTATGLDAQILHQIAAAINGLRYGAVHITVQDSRVVQIEKVEKIRLTKASADLPAPRRAQQARPVASPEGAARLPVPSRTGRQTGQAGLTPGGAGEDPSRADRDAGGSRPTGAR